MQVDEVLDIMSKLSAILELYRGNSVEEMLDDTLERLAGASPGAGRRKRPKAAAKLPPQEAAAILQDMAKEQRLELLESYIIKELKAIASLRGIKLPSKANKQEIVAIIAGAGDRPEMLSENKESDAVSPKPAVEGFFRIDHSQWEERLNQAVVAIQEMSEKEIIELLSAFNKIEILEIARRNNFKISSGNSKDNIIIMLAKNLGFKDLNRRISQRSQSE